MTGTGDGSDDGAHQEFPGFSDVAPLDRGRRPRLLRAHDDHADRLVALRLIRGVGRTEGDVRSFRRDLKLAGRSGAIRASCRCTGSSRTRAARPCSSSNSAAAPSKRRPPATASSRCSGCATSASPSQASSPPRTRSACSIATSSRPACSSRWVARRPSTATASCTSKWATARRPVGAPASRRCTRRRGPRGQGDRRARRRLLARLQPLCPRSGRPRLPARARRGALLDDRPDHPRRGPGPRPLRRATGRGPSGLRPAHRRHVEGAEGSSLPCRARRRPPGDRGGAGLARHPVHSASLRTAISSRPTVPTRTSRC